MLTGPHRLASAVRGFHCELSIDCSISLSHPVQPGNDDNHEVPSCQFTRILVRQAFRAPVGVVHVIEAPKLDSWAYIGV